jgi:hypothetical protein
VRPNENKTSIDVLSIESFNSSVLTHGPESVYQLNPEFARGLVSLLSKEAGSSDNPGLRRLYEAHSQPAKLQQALGEWVKGLSHDDASQTLIDTVTLRMQDNLGDDHLNNVLLIQLEELARMSLQKGWSNSIEAVFGHLLDRAETQQETYGNFRVEDREWTIESFVGDYFLRNGLSLFSESLEDLVDSLRCHDEHQVEVALDWLSEAFFYLDAAQEWSKNPWI